MNLNQVTVPCVDLADSVAFYRRLGLRLIVHDPPRYARFECPSGSSTFSLHLAARVESQSAPVVYFEVEDLDRRVCRGVGRALVESLVDHARRARHRVILGRIEAGNDPSRKMLLGCGFSTVGTMHAVGEKFGRVLDVEIFELVLDGAKTD